ncbi:hypothetical protein AGMMS49579_16810 [Spirochaetia bacterium]|nr:hypothetical protein AGMMS49579_16810 [Spirochaetia bacterium]
MSSGSEKLREILSANIKDRRRALGISQEKLAIAAELSSQTINDIEGCRMWVSDKSIVKLAGALKVEAYQLLDPAIKLEGDRSGQYSIKINDQCRISFKIEHGDVPDIPDNLT